MMILFLMWWVGVRGLEWPAQDHVGDPRPTFRFCSPEPHSLLHSCCYHCLPTAPLWCPVLIHCCWDHWSPWHVVVCAHAPVHDLCPCCFSVQTTFPLGIITAPFLTLLRSPPKCHLFRKNFLFTWLGEMINLWSFFKAMIIMAVLALHGVCKSLMAC